MNKLNQLGFARAFRAKAMLCISRVLCQLLAHVALSIVVVPMWIGVNKHRIDPKYKCAI